MEMAQLTKTMTSHGITVVDAKHAKLYYSGVEIGRIDEDANGSPVVKFITKLGIRKRDDGYIHMPPKLNNVFESDFYKRCIVAYSVPVYKTNLSKHSNYCTASVLYNRYGEYDIEETAEKVKEYVDNELKENPAYGWNLCVRLKFWHFNEIKKIPIYRLLTGGYADYDKWEDGKEYVFFNGIRADIRKVSEDRKHVTWLVAFRTEYDSNKKRVVTLEYPEVAVVTTFENRFCSFDGTLASEYVKALYMPYSGENTLNARYERWLKVWSRPPDDAEIAQFWKERALELEKKYIAGGIHHENG